jgi:uncharacterized membrane protein affecting hemolysin expression
MNNQSSQSPPPKLFRGLFLSPLIITFSILLITWFIINQQIEELAVKRTSEYASSIAKISADLSAEPLLSEDTLQLNLLVKNIAKNLYIYKATVYSEDGQIVSQYPDETSLSPALNIDTSNEQSIANKEFISRSNNIPYIEKITYQTITAGWFKIEVNKQLLESDFRESFNYIQNIIITISLLLFVFLIFYLAKKNKHVESLITSCQNLLLTHHIDPPSNPKEWLESVKKVSHSKLTLTESVPIKKQNALSWNTSKTINNTIIAYLEFKVPLGIQNNLSELSIAFHYCDEAIKSYGAKFQGDIFSNVIILFDNKNKENAINDLLSIILLMQKLFGSLTNEIDVKSCISQTELVQFFNKSKNISNLLIREQSLDAIKKQMLELSFKRHAFLQIEEAALELSIALEHVEKSSFFKGSYLLKVFPQQLESQIIRKFNYIKVK